MKLMIKRSSLSFFSSFPAPILSLLGFAFLFSLSFSPIPAHSLQIPDLGGPVMDEARILDMETSSALERILRKAFERGKVQLQVYVISTLEGLPIESATIQMVDKWKLGDSKKDNGVLFLVVIQDKKMRIEVGQGLEGELPDIYAKRIISDQVAPYFKKRDFDTGIIMGVVQILKRVDSEFNYVEWVQNPALFRSADKVSSHRLPPRLPQWFIFLLLFGLFGFSFLISAFSRWGGGGPGSGQGRWRGGGGFWGGGGGFGGSGGGSWGGGGGGFSGGGASGDW